MRTGLNLGLSGSIMRYSLVVRGAEAYQNTAPPPATQSRTVGGPRANNWVAVLVVVAASHRNSPYQRRCFPQLQVAYLSSSSFLVETK